VGTTRRESFPVPGLSSMADEHRPTKRISTDMSTDLDFRSWVVASGVYLNPITRRRRLNFTAKPIC